MGQIIINNYSVTGDCSNLSGGSVSFEITGDSPTWAVSEVTTSGLFPTSAATTGYTVTNLPAGSYWVQVEDSAIPTSSVDLIPVYISSGTCVSIEAQSTTCGNDNGSITATTEYVYGPIDFYLYDINDNLVDSAIGVNNDYVFNSLSADTYYVSADDGGGCSGRSESCIILSSMTIDYGLFVVNDANCVSTAGSGKIFVTGLTGNPPFTYLWSNGETTPSVTGLTGTLLGETYSVIVTDNNGCSVSKQATVTKISPVQIGGFTVTAPSCFSSDGEVIVTIVDGTAPYYYEGSNGESTISFAQTYTFTGLSSGNFSVYVRDSGLCEDTGNTTLTPVNGFTINSINVTNSNCGNNGEINISLNSGVPPTQYIYTLIDSSSNTTQIGPISNNTYQFTNLASDTYTLEISGGTCFYTQSVTIDNDILFNITATTVDTTCGINNGSISISASTGGLLPYFYEITGFPQQTGGNFNGLAPGNYTATVTDSDGCQQTQNVTIGNSVNVDFSFVTTQPSVGDDGEIDVLITVGEPPFTLNWSPNVGGQTGLNLTGLTAGTYTLEVIDDNGCVLERTTTLQGTTKVVSYDIYKICDSNFEKTNIVGKRGVRQMYNEGFYDLTYDDVNCVVDNAEFILKTNVNGEEKTVSFYNSTGLTDFPSDVEWANVLIETLESYEGIGDVEISYTDNTIQIQSICTNTGSSCNPTYQNTLADSKVEVNLSIEYNISCVECDVISGECECFQIKIYDKLGFGFAKLSGSTGTFPNGQPYWQFELLDTTTGLPYNGFNYELSQFSGSGQWQIYEITTIGQPPNTGLLVLDSTINPGPTCPTDLPLDSWTIENGGGPIGRVVNAKTFSCESGTSKPA